MQKALTDAYISGLEKPPSGRIEVSDLRCIGLSFRLTSAGTGSFTFRYRLKSGGGVQRVTLGKYPDVGLSKARERANDLRASVVAGENPASQRRLERAGGRAYSVLAERYLKEHAARHKREVSRAWDERNLRLHVLPKWGKRDYLTIKRADVIELVEGIVSDGKPTLANRIQSLVSKIFSFAVDSGLREDHPCARMKRRGVEAVGERVLSDAELPLFWNHVVDLAGEKQNGLALRLILLTACRRSEIAGLSRAELRDIDNPATAAIVIPGSRTKNKRQNVVQLAPMARQCVLDLLALIHPDQPYLLPTVSGKRSGPIGPDTLTHAMANFATKVGEMGEAGKSWTASPPTPHDLRRTVETRLSSLGVAKEYRDRVLNHVPGDVGSKHYDKHDYAAEKRSALLRWESLIATLLSGNVDRTVIPFGERAGR